MNDYEEIMHRAAMAMAQEYGGYEQAMKRLLELQAEGKARSALLLEQRAAKRKAA